MGAAEIVAGWYADPLVPGHIRYWDGSGWTEHTAAPVRAWAPHPMATFPASAAPVPPAAPRAPRRPLPLPARFVLGTALIGFPLAIGIGVLAAHASAPPPLETPAAAEPTSAAPTSTPAESSVPPGDTALPENDADAAAKTDATALRLAINRYYQQTWRATPPVLSVADGTYLFDPEPYGGKTWTWPPITMSDGVSLGGENGDSMVTWCVWLRADGGLVKDWQATNDGVSPGTCGLG